MSSSKITMRMPKMNKIQPCVLAESPVPDSASCRSLDGLMPGAANLSKAGSQDKRG